MFFYRRVCVIFGMGQNCCFLFNIYYQYLVADRWFSPGLSPLRILTTMTQVIYCCKCLKVSINNEWWNESLNNDGQQQFWPNQLWILSDETNLVRVMVFRATFNNTWSLVLCVCFVDRCLSFCTFSFGHCVVWDNVHQHILCCVLLFVGCLCLVSCVPNVARFSGLSILDCAISFL
jgi:hypothetical protein